MSGTPTPGRQHGGRGRDRGRGWAHQSGRGGSPFGLSLAGSWRSCTPHSSLLLPPAQMIRAGRRPRPLHTHPSLAWPSSPCLSAAHMPLTPPPFRKESREREEGGWGENSEEQTQGEKMDAMMGAIGLGKSEGWQGAQAGQSGQRPLPGTEPHPGSKCTHASGSVGVGPDHPLPSSSQQCPRETSLRWLRLRIPSHPCLLPAAQMRQLRQGLGWGS